MYSSALFEMNKLTTLSVQVPDSIRLGKKGEEEWSDKKTKDRGEGVVEGRGKEFLA